MAEDTAIEVTDPTSEDEEEDEGEEEQQDEEFVSADEEFRELFADTQEIEVRFKRIAGQLQRVSPEASQVLLQVAGDLVPHLAGVISATGAHLSALDDRIASLEEGSEEGLSLEDAKLLYRTLMANNKLWEQVVEQALSEQKETIVGIMQMNTEAMGRIIELSDEELPELIQRELEQVQLAKQDGTGPSN